MKKSNNLDSPNTSFQSNPNNQSVNSQVLLTKFDKL